MENDADQGPELVSCITAALPDAKEIAAACEEIEIEALLARADCCGKNGCACAPKIQVLVAKEDVPRVAKLLSERWWQLLEREGTFEGERRAAAGAGRRGTRALPGLRHRRPAGGRRLLRLRPATRVNQLGLFSKRVAGCSLRCRLGPD